MLVGTFVVLLFSLPAEMLEPKMFAGLHFGHLAGGIFLAFPAVLPASLTLLEKSGEAKADIDAVGAIVGSCGTLAFTVVGAFGLRRLGPVVALGPGASTWVVVSRGLFFAVRLVLDRRF
ncbi:MAG TPA: DUF3147 family protein [Candidatus Dormibacteraeota bacterium]|nr:DUF3147 family protein [Candidatus Dormibacteraeota bacterium]